MSRPPLYVWATDSVYSTLGGSPGDGITGTSTRTAPAGGADSRQTQGVRPGDQLAAQLFNALFGVAYDFLNWLNAGVLDGNWEYTGTVQVDGTLTALGATTVGGAAITFPATVFTASSSTDQLAITAHGLQTGDGPFQVTNSGGALPSPLVAATNYWIIRVDADHFQLALSRADALRSIAIDLTSNGSGTNTIAGVSATRTADETLHGNLAVDGVITTGGPLRRGSRGGFPQFIFRNAFIPGGNPAGGGLFPALTCAAPAADEFSVDYDVGDRLIGFKVWLYGDGTTHAGLDISIASTMGAALTLLGELSVAPVPTGWTLYTVLGPGGSGTFTPHTLAEGELIMGKLSATAANLSVGGIVPIFG